MSDDLPQLYAILVVLEKLYPTDSRISLLVAKMRTNLDFICRQLACEIPGDLTNTVNWIVGLLPKPPASAAADNKGGKTSRDPELVAAACTILDEMVSCGLFSWANMVYDMVKRIHEPDAFFTPKQARAILNIATKGRRDDEETFLSVFADEHPDSLKLLRDWADTA
jgi:hypothetical protein